MSGLRAFEVPPIVGQEILSEPVPGCQLGMAGDLRSRCVVTGAVRRPEDRREEQNSRATADVSLEVRDVVGSCKVGNYGCRCWTFQGCTLSALQIVRLGARSKSEGTQAQHPRSSAFQVRFSRFDVGKGGA